MSGLPNLLKSRRIFHAAEERKLEILADRKTRWVTIGNLSMRNEIFDVISNQNEFDCSESCTLNLLKLRSQNE